MRAVAYYRVSTAKQGASGLGLDAQADTVQRHLNGAEPLATYVEVESGRRDDRPELRRALDHARRAGACLVVAKVDRLARSTRFLLELLDSGVEVTFCDMPQVAGPAGRLMLTMLAGVAEMEAGLISERTKAALQAAKARGVQLGNPDGAAVLARHREAARVASAKVRGEAAAGRAEAWRATVEALAELSHSAAARALNARGERGVGGGVWTATSVRRLRERLGLVDRATAGRRAS
jgi:DNA invertase Pin-like site-specific DNA recombinase